MDPSILSSVNDIYTLIGLIILSIVYLITLFYKLKQNKKHTKELNDSFNTQTKELVVRIEMQNEKIIKRLDDIQEIKNNIDLQSSMDIIYTTITETMFCIIDEIDYIIDENEIDKKNLIKEKVNHIIESQSQEDLLILSRLFYKNTKLSEYVKIDKDEIVNNICQKIFLLRSKKQTSDIEDYIKSKYEQITQNSQLGLSNK
jgi:hypothetical protein